MPEPLTVAAFYKFVCIEDLPALQARIAPLCCANGLKGTILIASEGLNATIAGTTKGVDLLLAELKADQRFADMTVKVSAAEAQPFRRLKVKLKREIVTFGEPDANPGVRTGIALDAEAWNAVLAEPGTLVIDTRNVYEVALGTFPGAIDPGTRAFNEFPAFATRALDSARHRKIAMFCTGGIRCEKASSYLLARGFAAVYQLDGGILKYLATVRPGHNKWQGECYVFDRRVALTRGLAQGSFKTRAACGHPIPIVADDGQSAACPHCVNAVTGTASAS